ncbi:MAG: hypothetical protein LWW97_07125 [Deltaproteobacteria bacterium]|nr:hypothetical protein [Deltaproteobacteria bacterium]
MYYAIFPKADDDGMMLGVEYKRDHRGRSWHDGNIFTSDVNAPVWKQHPKVPIKVTIEQGYEKAPMPSFLRGPIPIMSKKLLNTVREAGVDNIDSYRVELNYADGTLASEDYYAFNLVGKLRAADLDKSVYDDNQPDKLIAMNFDSLLVDENKTYGQLMFRLAENISTILIHERIKKAIEEAGIQYIRICATKNVAIL